jgi:hypothetical protein
MEEHNQNLKMGLDWFREAGLCLKPTKCVRKWSSWDMSCQLRKCD